MTFAGMVMGARGCPNNTAGPNKLQTSPEERQWKHTQLRQHNQCFADIHKYILKK